MQLPKDAVLLKIYIGESDRWKSQPLYEAIVLAAVSKTGIPEARFYKQLLTCADHRFSLHRARAASTSTRH